MNKEAEAVKLRALWEQLEKQIAVCKRLGLLISVYQGSYYKGPELYISETKSY